MAEDIDDLDADRDSWRYREEEEIETAGSGNVAPPDRAQEPGAKVDLHQRLRKGYLGLMKALTQRVEGIRDLKKVASRDELLRLDIVTTLMLQAAGREVEGATQCGPLVQFEDLERGILPSIAILFSRSDGPVLDREGVTLSDRESKEASCLTVMLLSALVAHRRQRAEGRIRFRPDTSGLAGCLELLSVRTFMTLDKLGLLPTADVLKQFIHSFGPRSPWLFSLGEAVEVAFQHILEMSARIRELESGQAPLDSLPQYDKFEPGVWVYTRFWGVTEVLAMDGDKIDVVIVDAPGEDRLIRAKITRAKAWLTGLRRTF